MSEAFDSPRQEDQFSEIFGVLRRRKPFVVGGILLGLAAGIAVVLLATPSYQVVTRVLLQKYQGYTPSTSPVDRLNSVGTPPEIGAQLSLMSSPAILNDAFNQANVTLRPGDEINNQIVTVEQEMTSPVLRVEVNLPDPDSASRLAAAIPASFNQSRKAADDAQLAEALTNARRNVNTSRTAANASQATYEKFLADQGTNSVAAGGGEGAERTQQLNNFESQLESARVGETAAVSALQESRQALSNLPKEIEDTSQHPAVERLATQERVVAELTSQLKSMLATDTEKHPDVVALRARLKEEQAYLARLPKTVNQTGKIRNPELASYEARVSLAEQSLASAQSQVAKLQTIVATKRAALNAYLKRVPRQRELEADLGQKKAALDSASGALASLEAISNSSRPAAQVVAISNPSKTQPVIPRTLLITTLLGFILGVVAALLRDRFDNRVQTMEQIYDSSGVYPIGHVPVAGKPLALESGRGRSRLLESYRSLRFNLETSGTGEAVQSVLVASASAGEGRSSLAWNLASEAATDMRKTILVDADMRTPELHDRLKVARGPGLSDVLSGAVALGDALRETGQENLLFLSSGTEHINPLELLAGPSMDSAHEALKEMADVIIFNSPSLMRYTDGRALARVTDSVVFVAKRGFTRRDAMRYCVGMLRRAKARLLGVVLVDETGRTTDVPYFATE